MFSPRCDSSSLDNSACGLLGADLDISARGEIHCSRVTANGIAHFDVLGPNPKELHAFYTAMFGWEIDVRGPGYALVRTPNGAPDGAVVEAEHAGMMIGVVVPDLDAAIANAQAAGGTVVMPPTDNGWVVKAQVADPAGNRVSLIRA
jgi:predicted enzyme related to lactoylglutathione lyase